MKKINLDWKLIGSLLWLSLLGCAIGGGLSYDLYLNGSNSFSGAVIFCICFFGAVGGIVGSLYLTTQSVVYLDEKFRKKQ